MALELSSFKCGHDAPIYSVVEEIVEHSGTPYFCFKDIDENKPTGSIKIRVETIGYFLKRYREDMVRNKNKATNIDQQLKEFEARLRRQMLRDKTRRFPRAGELRARLHAANSRHHRRPGGEQSAGRKSERGLSSSHLDWRCPSAPADGHFHCGGW